MKQTSNYQFNLIESGDTFSPNPLNENMQKTEEALVDLDANCREGLAALTAAMGSGGSTARITFGSWTGNGTYGYSNRRTLTFDFKPVLVAAMQNDGRFDRIMLRGAACPSNYTTSTVEWGEKSVTFYDRSDTTGHLNQNGYTYCYVAVGV